MQQVSHRKLSFDYRLKTHRHNNILLQEKLRESEWKRSRLELEFKELVHQGDAKQETDVMGYKRRYRDLLESEKYRIRRNEQLIAALKRLEMRISFLSATAEKYKALRSKYQIFSNKSQRCGAVGDECRTGAALHFDEFISKSDSLNPMESSNRKVSEYFNEKAVFTPQRNRQNTTTSVYEPHPMQHGVTAKSHQEFTKNMRDYNDPEYEPGKIPRIYSETSQIQNITGSTLNEISNDDKFSRLKNNINGSENSFRGYGMKHSDNIRHHTANNSDIFSGTPKSEYVERPISNINKYSIRNTVPHDSSTLNPDQDIRKTHLSRMPEEILRKYQQMTPEENIISIPNVDFVPNMEGSMGEPTMQPVQETVIDELQQKIMSSSNFIPSEAKVETEETSMMDRMQPQYVKLENEMEKTSQKNNIRALDEHAEVENSSTKNITEKSENFKSTAENEKKVVTKANGKENTILPQTSHLNEQKSNTTPLLEENILDLNGMILSSQISPEQDELQYPSNEEIRHDGKQYIPIINTAVESTLDNLEVVKNLEPETVYADVVQNDEKLESESHEPESNEEHEPLESSHCQQPVNTIKPKDTPVENENSVSKDELFDEESSQLNLSQKGDSQSNQLTDLKNSQDEHISHHTNEEAEHEENFNQPNDQVVATVRQVETSNNNISNSNQNSQQDTKEQIFDQEEQNDNSEDMRKSKKRNSDHSQNQYQYYDQNNQNYPVDEQGQQYDMSGHPISYDPGMPSTTQYDDKGQPYVPGYEAVYNEKGELVMPYDPNSQQYDQQYYQNDPSYSNYDQYAQQYDDQQQYAEYDQQGYDPAQQTNYDESAQQGYDPNSQYNAYYAEVKYNQDAFYQGDTQETVQNPQHEENEEADKTNRLVHMLESDTENSSRQDNKVTTESDFDFSNN